LRQTESVYRSINKTHLLLVPISLAEERLSNIRIQAVFSAGVVGVKGGEALIRDARMRGGENESRNNTNERGDTGYRYSLLDHSKCAWRCAQNG
jgi:hypothetical protein